MTEHIKSTTARRISNVLAHMGKVSQERHECKNGGASSNSNKTSSCGTCVRQHDCAATTSSVPCDIEELPSKSYQRKSSADMADHNPSYLFDPDRFNEVQKPLLQASTLPSECYTSTTWFNRELERVFVPSWTLLGREDEISSPGEYLATDTEWGGPVAACRGTDGNVYAFANVCCHRGAKVLQGSVGMGSEVGLVCPYHAWTYDYDGTLKFAPGMKKSKHFKKQDVRLKPLSVGLFHGFVFVSVHSNPPPLTDCLGDLPKHLSDWFGENGAAREMVCAGRKEYDVPCNWKFLMENTCETYHTSVVHANSLGPMRARPVDAHRGDWDAVCVPSDRSIVPLPSDQVNTPLPSFTNRTAFVNLFPSLQINATWDCLWWMRLHPTSPTSTHIQMGFCFPKTTVSRPEFSSAFETYKRRWHIAVTEDNAISLNQQRGVRSMFREPGRFCQLEFGTHNFNNWLLSKMLDMKKSWDPGARVYLGEGDVFSNDDEKMRRAAENLASASKSK